MASGETEQNSTIVDTQEPTKKMPASSDGEETSTKATEENDSDTTMESKTSETKKDDNSDAETDVDDPSTSNEDSTTQEEKDKEAKENEEAEKKRIEELRIKYKDWPLKDIKDPHDNDVMYGRGGGTNHHPGNKRYRKLVEDRKVKYVNSKRLDKPMVALEIIRGWRAQLPSGRFLKHNDKTGNWDDVGDKKAREKTSQALREKAPQIKKQIQEEEEEKIGDDTGDKTTRFAKGTKENKKGKPKKGILARGHSLGTEYLASDENVDIEDFTWFPKKDGGKDTSIGSKGSAPTFLPAREFSTGSIGSFSAQLGRNIPDFFGKVSSEEPRREYSNGTLGSWNQPYPPPSGPPTHQRSGSWTHPPPPPPPYGPHHQRSGSWSNGREHSFSANPLPHTSINRSAPIGTFDPRTGSWSGPHSYPPGPPQMAPYPPHHPPPPAPYGGLAYQSGSSIATIGSIEPPPPGPYPPHAAAASNPPFDIDIMGAAKIWSHGGAAPPGGSFGRSQYYGNPQPVPGADRSPPLGIEPQHPHGSVPRPGMVKRETSNQNESYETKPSRIKRAALNRDQSATSNRLKQQYIPEVFNRDVQSLHEQTERQLRLHSPVPDRTNVSPEPLSRESTNMGSLEDAVADYVPKPSSLNQTDRKNTIDALGFNDLIDDCELQKIGGDDTNYPVSQPLLAPMRPPTLTQSDRLTTSEFLDMCDVSLPISNDKTNDDTPLPL